MNLDIDSKNFHQNIKLQPYDYDVGQNTTSNFPTGTDEYDIIILDDDDFIQTTLNLLENIPKTGSLDCDLLHSPIDSTTKSSCQQETNANDQNILIDLTSDFDLNDLFQMHENVDCQPFSVENTEEGKWSQQIIKNEFDFKVKFTLYTLI